jgi:hypothetical protein
VRPRAGGTNASDPAVERQPPRLSGRPPSGDSGRVLSLVLLQPDGTVLQTRRDPQTGVEVAEAMPGSVGGIAAYDAVWADWWFVPHAYGWSNRREQLLDAAKTCIKVHPHDAGFNEALVTKLRTPAGLRELKVMYRAMKSNGTSLSLYVGPPPHLGGRVSWSSPETNCFGWLLTGDAPLKSKKLIPFAKSFEIIKDKVNRLMLPHHGAEENFNKDLQKFVRNARLFVTVNETDFENNVRPLELVRRQLFKREELERVSEEQTTMLQDISGPICEQWPKEALNW